MPRHTSRIENLFPKEPVAVPHKPEERMEQTKQPLMEKVRSLFSWIASWATQEARREVIGSEHTPQQTLSVHLPKHLLQQVEASIHHLDNAKRELIERFGPQAEAFVDRYVEPILSPAHDLIESARRGEPVDVSRWAVASAELLSLVQDEEKLRRKIFGFCLEKTRDAILEDITFIASCPHELVESSWAPLSERPGLIKRIDADLQPILQEFEKLLTRRPQSHDLETLFRWRAELDGERQRLHDLSLATIDAQIQKTAPLWLTLQSGLGEIPSSSELEILAGEIPEWPLSILDLEETSRRLLRILETDISHRTDERVVAFFDRMRGRIQSVIESEDIHEASLRRLQKQVRAIERLLNTNP